jgi:hypothetical protein
MTTSRWGCFFGALSSYIPIRKGSVGCPRSPRMLATMVLMSVEKDTAYAASKLVSVIV